MVRFLLERRGPEAARAELDRLIAGGGDPRPFQRARAGLDFAEGDRDGAIAAMRGLLEGAEPSDATRELQVGLAEMLAATGQAAESAALLETVLAADAQPGGGAEAARQARHRRRPPRGGDPGHAHRAHPGPATTRRS